MKDQHNLVGKGGLEGYEKKGGQGSFRKCFNFFCQFNSSESMTLVNNRLNYTENNV